MKLETAVLATSSVVFLILKKGSEKEKAETSFAEIKRNAKNAKGKKIRKDILRMISIVS